MQYNNAGAFAGASKVEINAVGGLEIVEHTPAVPSASRVGLFGRAVAGRVLPAFIGPSGLDSAIQSLIARNKVSWATANGNSTTLSANGIALTATGTATAANVATTNLHTMLKRLEYAVTVAATTAVAGWRSSVAQFKVGATGSKLGGFFYVVRFGPSRGVAADSTRRFFVGLSSLTGAPTDVNPSTTETNAIGVGCDSTDTNWQIIHRTASGAATKIDTGIPKTAADNTEAYELALFSAPNQSTAVGYMFTDLTDDVVASGTITTNLPASSTLLAPRGWSSVGGTNSVIGISLASLYLETDY